MDHICGAGTNRACPGPGTPIGRGDATTPPTHVVPFSSAGSGPFNGPLF